MNTILSAKIKLPFNITYSFNASPRLQWFHDRYFESSEHPDWAAETHGANRGTAQNFDWSINNTINWDYTFADKHHLNLTLVQEAEERRYWSESINARYLLPTDGLGFTKLKWPIKKEAISIQTTPTKQPMACWHAYSIHTTINTCSQVRSEGTVTQLSAHPTHTPYFLPWHWHGLSRNEKFFRWKPLKVSAS